MGPGFQRANAQYFLKIRFLYSISSQTPKKILFLNHKLLWKTWVFIFGSACFSAASLWCRRPMVSSLCSPSQAVRATSPVALRQGCPSMPRSSKKHRISLRHNTAAPPQAPAGTRVLHTASNGAWISLTNRSAVKQRSISHSPAPTCQEV